MERTKINTITDWRLNAIDWVAIVLMIVGALNWGLVGLFEFNLVSFLFGEMSMISRIVYVLVGICAIWSIVSLAMHLHHRTFSETHGAVAH